MTCAHASVASLSLPRSAVQAQGRADCQLAKRDRRHARTSRDAPQGGRQARRQDERGSGQSQARVSASLSVVRPCETI